MRRASHSIALLLSALLAAARPAGADDAVGRWALHGEGLGQQAVWTGAGLRISVRCERGDPMVMLRITAPGLTPGLQRVTLVVDGLQMDYPVSKSGTTVAPSLESRIALDAPVLDRMLVARRFGVAAGGLHHAAGTPGPALARVVRDCRGLHWPREARIDSSDAGLAKK